MEERQAKASMITQSNIRFLMPARKTGRFFYEIFRESEAGAMRITAQCSAAHHNPVRCNPVSGIITKNNIQKMHVLLKMAKNRKNLKNCEETVDFAKE